MNDKPSSRRGLAAKHPLFFAYLFFLYFSAVYQLLIYISGTAGGGGLSQTFLMSVVWLIPLLIWPRHARPIAGIIGLAMWLTSAISLSYWMIYGHDFSQSTIFIIFESNFAEGSEFIDSYLNWRLVTALAAYSVVPVLMWRHISPIELTAPRSHRYALAFFLVFGSPFINGCVIDGDGMDEGVSDLLKGMESAAPWNLVIGYVKYRAQLSTMVADLDHSEAIPPLARMTERDEKAPQTLVLVIGESTNRHRMGLYGYTRNTTPGLEALKKELVVFDNVISPRPFTIEALQQALSFATQDDPEAYQSRPSLLGMMKQAGYDITWITNQQTQTKRNTMLTTLSMSADHQVYLNNNRRQDSYQFDGDVIAPFEQALNSAAPKKMIVVHLLGTHRKYTYRYPAEFDRFRTDEGVPGWVDSARLAEYNSYDNAVLYNDYVVSELLRKLRAGTGKRRFVYFADHGEEVYDTPDFLFSGRDEAHPTTGMYAVPFLLWSSEATRSQTDFDTLESFRHRPYILSDFIHTWADIAGLRFEGFEADRSIVSDHFRAHGRLIGDPGKPESLREFSDVFHPSNRGTHYLSQRH